MERTNEQITEAVGIATDFIKTYTEANDLDGADATSVLGLENGKRNHLLIQQLGLTAFEILTQYRHPKNEGFYVPLGKTALDNAGSFAYIKQALQGRFVLVPSAMLETSAHRPSLYPAAVSERSASDTTIRLHILQKPYVPTTHAKNIKAGISPATAIVLSASTQSETLGLGEKHTPTEAEHFQALLAVSNDPGLQNKWFSGAHINHEWKKSAHTSVTSEMATRLFGSGLPLITREFPESDFKNGRAALFWHDELRDNETNGEANRRDALVTIQALGFTEVRAKSDTLDSLKNILTIENNKHHD